MVRGGRTREAAALAWERQGPAPDRTSYKNWAKSVLDNPAVVESKVDTTVNNFCDAEKSKTLQKSKLKTSQKLTVCMCVVVQVLSIIDLVQGIPCAATKRRHLRKALLQYSEEFDTCKCAPCPNNARPVLSGTECKCVCQTGTFGTNCETRAPDYTSGTCSSMTGVQVKA